MLAPNAFESSDYSALVNLLEVVSDFAAAFLRVVHDNRRAMVGAALEVLADVSSRALGQLERFRRSIGQPNRQPLRSSIHTRDDALHLAQAARADAIHLDGGLSRVVHRVMDDHAASGGEPFEGRVGLRDAMDHG